MTFMFEQSRRWADGRHHCRAAAAAQRAERSRAADTAATAAGARQLETSTAALRFFALTARRAPQTPASVSAFRCRYWTGVKAAGEDAKTETLEEAKGAITTRALPPSHLGGGALTRLHNCTPNASKCHTASKNGRFVSYYNLQSRSFDKRLQAMIDSTRSRLDSIMTRTQHMMNKRHSRCRLRCPLPICRRFNEFHNPPFHAATSPSSEEHSMRGLRKHAAAHVRVAVDACYRFSRSRLRA